MEANKRSGGARVRTSTSARKPNGTARNVTTRSFASTAISTPHRHNSCSDFVFADDSRRVTTFYLIILRSQIGVDKLHTDITNPVSFQTDWSPSWGTVRTARTSSVSSVPVQFRRCRFRYVDVASFPTTHVLLYDQFENQGVERRNRPSDIPAKIEQQPGFWRDESIPGPIDGFARLRAVHTTGPQ